MLNSSTVLAVVLGVAIVARPGLSQEATPPPDRPFHTDSAAAACLERAIEARIAQAKRTFPQARDRFIAGLPAGHNFAVTIRLHDATGRFEQVFVTVDSIRGDSVLGRIASQIGFVRGFRYGQPYTVEVQDVLDWTILRPDGSEEGNFVGKYLDSLQTRLEASGIPKPC